MNDSLERALAESAKLPSHDQEWLAYTILELIKEERRWDESFARSRHVLGQMADEALRDYREGRTDPLDPDAL